MEASAISCKTCGSRLDATAFGSVCPACVLRAGYTPGASAKGPETTWAEVFPQLEVTGTLREETGYVIYRARIPDSPREVSAILQVVSGERFRQAGGSGALSTRARKLATAEIPAAAEVLDFGDLGDAYFLVTEAPEFPTLPAVLGGKDPEELDLLMGAIGESVNELHRTSTGAATPVPFDPALCFVDEETGRIVQTPLLVTAGGESGVPSPGLIAAGDRFGPFELLEKVGEGGFGEVWKAQQQRPVKRTVAVKILKEGFHSERARARFEIEQQALARLDHPHIARFFHGGINPEGRPYFAMEWIEGLAVNRHCRQKDSPFDERLRLFRQIAEAVHHAHQKGILHRDLKSSNVLVTDVDSEAAAKVIDFGIARAIEEPLTDRTLLTRAEEMVGTPASMSPEQAAGAGAAELDARTDVYGLGVLLYELLTGQLPFDPKLPADELLRQVRETDPLRPSNRVNDAQLRKQLRGDLDWITMRCLEKDPDRRYRSVSALLRDLERHAADEPVEAGAPELSYRIRKFARRNRAMVAGTMVAAVALVVGLLAALDGYRSASARAVEAREAQQTAESEAGKASEVTAFLKKHFFGQLNPTLNSARGLSLESAVMNAAEALDQEPFDSSEVEIEIRLTLAESFAQLALYPEAERQYRIAFELLAHGEAEQNPDTIDARARHAYVLSKLGRHREACAKQQQVMDYWRARSDPTRELRARRDYARYLFADHRLRDGIGIMEKVFEEQRDRLGVEHPETLESLYEVARFSWKWERDSAKAGRLLNELELPRIYSSGSIEAILAVNRVGLIGFDEDDLEVLRIRIEELEESGDCPSVELALLRLERALMLPSQEKKTALREACEQLEAIVGSTHPSVLTGFRALILELDREGEHDRVHELVEPILDRLESEGVCFEEREELVFDYGYLTGEWESAIRFYLKYAGQLDVSTLRKAAHVMVFTANREGFLRIRDALEERFPSCDDPYAAPVVVEALLDGLLFDPVVQPNTKLVSTLSAVAAREKPDWVNTRICAMRSALLMDDLETAKRLAKGIETEASENAAYQSTSVFDQIWNQLVRAECAARQGDSDAAEYHVRCADWDWRSTVERRTTVERLLTSSAEWLPIAAALDRAERQILGRKPAPPRVSPEGFGVGPGAEDGWLGDWRRARELNSEGLRLGRQGRYEESLDRFEQSARLLEGGDGRYKPFALSQRQNSCIALERLGRQDEMLEVARKIADCLRLYRMPEGDRDFARSLYHAGRNEEANAVLEEQVAQMESSPESDPYELIASQVTLAGGYPDQSDKRSILMDKLVGTIRQPHLGTRRLADAIRCSGISWGSDIAQTLFAEVGERQLAEIEDAGEETDVIAFYLLQTAIFLAKDPEAHERFSRQMVRALSDSPSIITQGRIWYGTLCIPIDDPALAEEAVRRMGADNSQLTWARYWHNFIMALACYRAGYHEVALQHLAESPRPLDSIPGGTLETLHLLMEALSRHQLGEKERAVELFEKVRSGMGDLRASHPLARRASLLWHDMMACELLFNEAEGLIDGEARRHIRYSEEAVTAAEEGDWSLAAEIALRELKKGPGVMPPVDLAVWLQILLKTGKSEDFARLWQANEGHFWRSDLPFELRIGARLCGAPSETSDPDLIDDARQLADKAMKGAEEGSRDYYLGALALGLVELRLGNLDEADRLLKAACDAPDELVFSHLPARAYRAVLAHQSGRPEEAAEHLAFAEEALKGIEEDRDNWIDLRFAEMAIEEARAALRGGRD